MSQEEMEERNTDLEEMEERITDLEERVAEFEQCCAQYDDYFTNMKEILAEVINKR